MDWKKRAKFWIRSALGRANPKPWLRFRRTKQFLRRRLHLTPFHFVGWKDAPANLGIDLLVVGSDQVWHCGTWGNPLPYLLDGAPPVPAISYAASFGMAELPQFLRPALPGKAQPDAEPAYRAGLSRFKALSCREMEGVEICRRLGKTAVHVVDPVLLAWLRDGQKMECCPDGPLVCYFLSEDAGKHMDELTSFSRETGCRVRVFISNERTSPVPPGGLKARFRRTGGTHQDVAVEDSAGPEEFFRAFQGARWVLSDSFHALMFAILHGCDARILRPATELRRQMFARIEEFASHAKGPLVADSVGSALASFARGEHVEYDYGWLCRRRRESEEWLERNIASQQG